MRRELKAEMRWFDDMVGHCLDYAVHQKQRGHFIAGILCEFTPRELIMAAGGIPVCLCGGDPDMIMPAEQHLPSNLCPLIKSTYGYHVTGQNPFLEMCDLVVAETTCDGKKKMFELMAEKRTMHVLELPQKAGDKDAFAHWLGELRKFQACLEQRYAVRITPERLRKAIRIMNRERAARRAIMQTLRDDHPALTGRQVLDLKSLISGMPDLLIALDGVLKAAKTVRPRPVAPPPVRVLLTGVPVVHGAERVVDLIESHGGLIACMENCTGIKPVIEDVDVSARDPVEALARKYYGLQCSVMTPNDQRLELLGRLAGEYRPDCLIDLVWRTCLTYDVESTRVKRLARERGLPYLRIETDYSPSDSARIALRVEALFETVRRVRR